MNMKKLSIVSLLAILSMCLASCQDKKTSGFNKSDLVGSWEEVTLGMGEPFCLNEDGTGTSEGFLRTHFLNWDLRNDSLLNTKGQTLCVMGNKRES